MSAADEPSPALSSSASISSNNNNNTPGLTSLHQQRLFEAGVPTPPALQHKQQSQQPPRKRRRIIISCTECHRRKQKCDRSLPCSNCVARNKQDSCRFETGAPTVSSGSRKGSGVLEGLSPTAAKQRRPRASKYDVDVGMRRDYDAAQAGAVRRASVPDSGVDGGAIPDSSTNPVNFGYTPSGASTLGFLKKLDDDTKTATASGAGTPLASMATVAGGLVGDSTAYFGTRERYRSLVRQLPARPYIEKLVDVFFKEVNWQYNGIDQYIFDKQMEEWYSLPFHVLNTDGLQAFPPDLRAFPALVFQMIATGLMMLGSGSDPTFDSLKYNSSMTFDDLAADYSESGVAILALLGKRNISHTAVLADWVRAGFLKYAGLVTESWHAVGTAIRDAQEAGLHMDSLDPKPKSTNLEDILENQWEIQRRRKTWCILMVWDVHVGIVLGRPTTIDMRLPYTLPVDAPTPKDPSRTPVTQRKENEPPSLITRTLYVYKIIIALADIKELEKEGPCPKDFSKVDRLHEKLLDLEAQTPAYFRKQNPDTRFDDLPECFWIPLVRDQLHPLVWLNFMALHRPYIFTRPHSRTEALKASLKMLEAQRDNFARMNNTYQLFFGTFDAVVLMASIFILFPKDNAEYVTAALKHFQWAVDRFENMAERNRLAAAARGVLHALHARLKTALQGVSVITSGAEASYAPFSSNSHNTQHSLSFTAVSAGESYGNRDIKNSTSPPSNSNGTSSSGAVGGTRSNSSIFTPPSGSEHYFKGALPIDPSLTGGESIQAPPPQQQQGDFGLPEGFDWSSIQPVYAMADVACNDLTGISEAGGASLPNWAGGAPLLNEGAPSGGDGPLEWSFGGGFGADSVWNLLNQFPVEFRG